MKITMWLLKFHEDQEFHDFKISEDTTLLKQYVKEKYGLQPVKIVQCLDYYQIIIDGEEIGCIGPVEAIIDDDLILGNI